MMLETGYILLSAVMLLIILAVNYKISKKYFKDSISLKKNTRAVFIYLLGWLLYVCLLSKTEALVSFEMPPRFPIFMVIPLIIFCVLFYRKNKNSAYIQSIPLHVTIGYQSFRILVEILLFYTFVKGIIPKEATFEGLNYDIIMGILALPLSFLVYNTGQEYKTLLRIWNVVGIVMVAFVAVIIATNIYQPQLWGYSTPKIKKEFVKLPYLLIPALLAPSAIIMHVVSLIQLNKDAND